MSARISSRSADLDRSASPEYLTVELPLRTVQQWFGSNSIPYTQVRVCCYVRRHELGRVPHSGPQT